MKKLFLLSLAVASAATMASAQDFVSGGTQIFKDGYKLSVEWGNVDMLGDATCRVGTGTNDKFFLNDYAAGTVKIFGQKGLIKDLKIADNLWVSNTADDAGHIIVRGTAVAWPGNGQYGGCYYPGTGNGDLIYVVDAATETLLTATPLELKDGYTGRFDALGHVHANVVEDFWDLIAIADGTGQGEDFMYDGIESEAGCEQFAITIAPEFDETSANKIQTLGIGQIYGEANEEGYYQNMAVLANNYLLVTSSDAGLGNGIARYDYLPSEDDPEAYAWQYSGEFFVTPQHASTSGFMVFELAGKQFIIYTSGEGGGAVAPDAFGISEVKFTDTPASDPEEDKNVLVARLFPATNDAGGFLYKGGSNFTSYNVEPVEGEPNSVYIYTFCQGGPMIKLKFTAPETGVEAVQVVENENAPVEYYNLQGIRVANPENGIFIRRQGNEATKVVL